MFKILFSHKKDISSKSLGSFEDNGFFWRKVVLISFVLFVFICAYHIIGFFDVLREDFGERSTSSTTEHNTANLEKGLDIYVSKRNHFDELLERYEVSFDTVVSTTSASTTSSGSATSTEE